MQYFIWREGVLVTEVYTLRQGGFTQSSSVEKPGLLELFSRMHLSATSAPSKASSLSLSNLAAERALLLGDFEAFCAALPPLLDEVRGFYITSLTYTSEIPKNYFRLICLSPTWGFNGRPLCLMAPITTLLC